MSRLLTTASAPLRDGTIEYNQAGNNGGVPRSGRREGPCKRFTFTYIRTRLGQGGAGGGLHDKLDACTARAQWLFIMGLIGDIMGQNKIISANSTLTCVQSPSSGWREVGARHLPDWP